jgi:glycosyltransferase involved in cell wall biosynthesis
VDAARELGVEDLVVWHGHVPDEERDRILAAAWLALLPSTKEGWGLSVVEAAAKGTPTIGYREAGGVNESIDDGETGVLVDGLDEAVEAARHLLRHPDLLEQMSDRARGHAGRYSWDTSAKAFEEILLEVARGSGRRSSRRRRRGQFVP